MLRSILFILASGWVMAAAPGSVAVAAALPGAADEPVYDVVVYGGTSAGVIAAVQTARMGRTAIVIEPGRHLGGLSSGGLGWTDSGDKSAIGGLSREFYQRIKRHYDRPEAWVHERPADLNRDRQFGRYEGDADAMWVFEPHVAERVFHEMIEEAGAPVVYGERLGRDGDGVRREGMRITAIVMESGRVFRGRMFIDATYEGDLMAEAGVSYAVGRESNETYGETLNGVQKANNVHAHRFIERISPYADPDNPAGGLAPRVHGGDAGRDGAADHRIQAYCFRMCMTDVPANRVPWPKPEGYDARQYELLLRNFEQGDHRLPLKIDMMPNRKTDTNNNGAFSTDNIGYNYDYPEASYERREQIIAEHERYQKGLMWTLAHHPRVPEPIRKRVGRWGLAADEFTDNGHWPHQLYIREARRMVSDYVMTEHDCRRTRPTPQSVGLGSYNMDSHNVQRYITADGHVQNEGDIQVSPGGPYMISYLAIRPREEECANLLVPVCLSSSHIAYGSIRMEPVFMVLGQSAATAAVLAIGEGTTVQRVEYEKLRRRLLADGQALDTDAPPHPPRITLRPEELGGIVVDDGEAELIGAWVASGAIAPFIGVGYRHDDHAADGGAAARFEPELPEGGLYEVQLAYAPHPNRATNVPVTIHHAGGRDTVRVNQREAPALEGAFVSLGRYRFSADRPAAVVVTNASTDGYVIVDAARWVRVD